MRGNYFYRRDTIVEDDGMSLPYHYYLVKLPFIAFLQDINCCLSTGVSHLNCLPGRVSLYFMGVSWRDRADTVWAYSG